MSYIATQRNLLENDFMRNDLDQISASFEANGFVIIPDFLSADRLAEIREMFDRVLDGTVKPDSDPDAEDFHIQWEPAVKDDPDIPRHEKIRIVLHLAHTHSFFWELATSDGVLDVISAVLGPNLRFYSDQTFVKPAHHGSAVPWHQDSAYWPAVEPNLVSCWIALDDVSTENGCVRYIPGSQKQAEPHHTVEWENPNKLTTRPEYIDESLEVPAGMRAGSACLHHSLVLHHSLPNTSGKSRRGMVLIYLPADLEFYRPWPWNFKHGFKLLRGKGGEEYH